MKSEQDEKTWVDEPLREKTLSDILPTPNPLLTAECAWDMEVENFMRDTNRPGLIRLFNQNSKRIINVKKILKECLDKMEATNITDPEWADIKTRVTVALYS